MVSIYYLDLVGRYRSVGGVKEGGCERVSVWILGVLVSSPKDHGENDLVSFTILHLP